MSAEVRPRFGDEGVQRACIDAGQSLAEGGSVPIDV